MCVGVRACVRVCECVCVWGGGGGGAKCIWLRNIKQIEEEGEEGRWRWGVGGGGGGLWVRYPSPPSPLDPSSFPPPPPPPWLNHLSSTVYSKQSTTFGHPTLVHCSETRENCSWQLARAKHKSVAMGQPGYGHGKKLPQPSLTPASHSHTHAHTLKTVLSKPIWVLSQGSETVFFHSPGKKWCSRGWTSVNRYTWSAGREQRDILGNTFESAQQVHFVHKHLFQLGRLQSMRTGSKKSSGIVHMYALRTTTFFVCACFFQATEQCSMTMDRKRWKPGEVESKPCVCLWSTARPARATCTAVESRLRRFGCAALAATAATASPWAARCGLQWCDRLTGGDLQVYTAPKQAQLEKFNLKATTS